MDRWVALVQQGRRSPVISGSQALSIVKRLIARIPHGMDRQTVVGGSVTPNAKRRGRARLSSSAPQRSRHVRLDHLAYRADRLLRHRLPDAGREHVPAHPLRTHHAHCRLHRRPWQAEHGWGRRGGQDGRPRGCAALVLPRSLGRPRAAQALGGQARALADDLAEGCRPCRRLVRPTRRHGGGDRSNSSPPSAP